LKCIGVLKVETTLRVSAKGEVLALTLPKWLVESHDLLAGDYVEVRLMRHYRPKYMIPEEGMEAAYE